MDTVILICCGAILILLIVVLVRSFSGSGKGDLNQLENEIIRLQENSTGANRQLMDQVARQSEASVRQVSLLGDGIREEQARQQARTDEAMTRMRTELDGFRRDTDGRLTQINGVVTEKMQTILDRKLNEAFDTVVKNMSDLGKTLNDGQQRQQQASDERLAALAGEFAKMRTELLETLDKVRRENTESLDRVRTDNRESLERLRTDNQASLDRINQTVNEKLQKTLDDRITQSFETVNKRLAEVYEGLGEMKNVASGVSDLKNVLSNVKNRGIMGEIQLSAILGDILAPEQYESQFRLDPSDQMMVDFAVRLPGPEDGDYVYLPIDSKFPGDTWASLAAAYDAGDPALLKQRRTAMEQEIKRCAKSIRDKYVRPPRTTDFAILFLPFEGLYAEVVNLGLVEVLQREYRVNITGPSTMAAMLNSLQMGFRTLAIQKKSGEVWKILEAAKKEFASFEDVLDKTRDRLRQADEELDKLIGTRTRAINRKLRTVSALDSAENAAEVLELTD